jgi:hypothetical protein
MAKQELIRFHHGWGQAIRNGLGMWRGNTALVKSCSERRQGDDFEFPDNASMALIEDVWEHLQKEEPVREQPNKPMKRPMSPQGLRE